MAIVNGPLFSLDASGAIGKALVFTKWKGRNVVREYVTPANPRSILQRGRRTMVALLNSIWSGMDTTDKESWADLAASGNYSNFNGYTSYNLDQQTDNLGITKNRDDTPTAIILDAGVTVAQDAPNSITATVTINVADSGSYVLIGLNEGGTSADGNLKQIVGFVPGANTGTYEVEITNLPAGAYTVDWFYANDDGTLGTSEGDEGITVTGTY